MVASSPAVRGRSKGKSKRRPSGVTSEPALFVYKCTEFYNPALEGCVRWNDPQIGIKWPINEPALSDKDKTASLLREIPREKLPQYPSS